MSNHYRRYLIALSSYQPVSSSDLYDLDRVCRIARQADKLGRSSLALALVDLAGTVSGDLRQAVLVAANRVSA